MADSSDALLYGGLAAGAAYVIWRMTQTAAPASSSASTAAQSVQAQWAGGATATQTSGLSKDQLYRGMIQAASADTAVSGSGDFAKAVPAVWTVYLAQVLGGISPLPNLGIVFPGADLNAPMAAVDFWTGASKYV